MQASRSRRLLTPRRPVHRGRVAIRHWILGLTLCAALPVAALAETVVLEPIRDATLIESSNGARANGSGPALFAGNTSSARDARRRALVAFDVASAVPAGAWVTRVDLHLELTPSNPAPADVRLHRVTSSWSEGPSVANGGGGAPAEPGDATWIHTSSPAEFWATPGGDFEPSPSASATIADAGPYVWASTPSMVDDVQGWLDDPSESDGWILIGNEDAPTTAKRFASREATDAASRPRLVIEFEESCEDTGLARGALGLCRAYCEVLQCWRAPAAPGRACEQLSRNFERQDRGQAPPCDPSGVDGGD